MNAHWMIISNVHYPRIVLFLLTESKSSAGHKSIHLVLSTASEIREETCTIETGRKLYFHYHWILHCSIWTTCMMIKIVKKFQNVLPVKIYTIYSAWLSYKGTGFYKSLFPLLTFDTSKWNTSVKYIGCEMIKR